MKTLGKYVWRILMTALVAVGIAGGTAQLNLIKTQRMKALEHQWTQVHSSRLESDLVAEQARVRRNWFIGVAVGLFVLQNIVLGMADLTARKPTILENSDTPESANP